MQKYHQQKQQILGGQALRAVSNSAVSANSVWNVEITSNTSIIRIQSDEDIYAKLASNVTFTSWDYFVPALNSLDLYNVEDHTLLSLIARSSNSMIHISQY